MLGTPQGLEGRHPCFASTCKIASLLCPASLSGHRSSHKAAMASGSNPRLLGGLGMPGTPDHLSLWLHCLQEAGLVYSALNDPVLSGEAAAT